MMTFSTKKKKKIQTTTEEQHKEKRTRRVPNRAFFLALFVLLSIATTSVAAGGLPCNSDSQCRRNVCIFRNCASRPLTGGRCETNNHCFYSASESCISQKCAIRSPLEGPCEESQDCSNSVATCENSQCLLPLNSPCSKNSECVSALACINSFCSVKSATGGDCDEEADCAKEEDVCLEKVCAIPIDPSLMVWEGNKPSSDFHGGSSGVAVNGLFYVFSGNEDGTVEAYDPLADSWTPRAAGPVLAGYTPVVVGTSVFIIGGRGANNALLDTLYKYDTISDSWETDWPALPTGLSGMGATVVDNTLYLFGGFIGIRVSSNAIYSLDVSDKDAANTNGWETLSATLPNAMNGASATAVGTNIFITGGTESYRIFDAVLLYDTTNPDTNPTPLNPMLSFRYGHSSFFDPNTKRLYVVGGTTFLPSKTVEYLDLTVDSSGSWVSANAPNYLQIASNSGGLIDSVYYINTNNIFQVLDISNPDSVMWSPFSNSPSPQAEVVQMTDSNTITSVDTLRGKTSFYDTVSNTWTIGVAPSIFPISIQRTVSAVVNGDVFVMGGEDNSNAISEVYAMTTTGGAWIQQDSLPSPRSSGCGAAYGTDIYFFGGIPDLSSSPVSDLYKMDTTITAGNNLQWSMITPKGETPTAMRDCVAVVANGKLLIIGGNPAFAPSGAIQSFDIASQTWEQSPASLITPRLSHSAVYLKGFVFVIGGKPDGGYTLTAKVEVFDVISKTVTTIADIITPRYFIDSVTDGTSIFSVGGFTEINDFPSLERLHFP